MAEYHVGKGVTSTGITLSDWNDYVHVSFGGMANLTTVNDGGGMYVYGGGTANSTTLNNGWMEIYEDGVANGITVNSAGNLLVDEGGTALNIAWTPCVGAVHVEDGATVTFTSRHQGVFFGSDGNLLSSSMKLEGQNISGYNCSMYVMEKGVAEAAVIDSGRMDVREGGTANSTTINSDGQLYVSRGGVANSVVVGPGGYLEVSSGGSALNVDWTPCQGDLWVRNGAKVTFASRHQGVFFGSDGNLLSSAMKMEGKSVSGYNCSLYVMEKGVAEAAVIEDGYVFVESGGAANSTVLSNGWMYVRNGGTANSTTVNGGSLYVTNGGVISSTTVGSYGYLKVSSGGVANSVVVGPGGSLKVSSGGSALNVTWTPCEGDVRVKDGAKVTFTKQHQGVFFGSDNTLHSSAMTMAGKNVGSGCIMYVMEKGVAEAAVIGDLGEVIVSRGGVANSTTLSSGWMDVYEGGAVNKTTVNNDGRLEVDGTATSTTVNAGGEMEVDGTATSTTVNAGGEMEVEGTATSTIVKSGGYMFIAETGKHTGTLQIADGAVVSAHSGSVIDFTVAGRSAADGYLINNLSLVQGNPDFSITVSAAQSQGTYNLAQGAAAFDKTVTIRNTNGASDSIAVGKTVSLAGKKYTLNRNADALTLTVGSGSAPAPAPEPDFDVKAPTGLTVTVSKYNATATWTKTAAPKGVKASYEVMVDGKTYASTSNKFALKNAAVGNHTFAVRVLLSNGKRSSWTADAVKEVKDITAPKSGKVTITQTAADSVKVAWSAATDNVGIDHYVVSCGGKSQTLDGKTLSAVFTGVGGKVDATVTAYDAAGNAGKTVKKSVKLADVTAPTQATGLAAQGTVDNKSGGILTWKASTDNSGAVAQYLISISGESKVYKSKTNSLKLKKLAAGSYTFTVVAVDKAKNESPVSAVGSFTVKDVIDPKVKKLSAKVTDDTALVTWNATDETGLGSLKLSVNGGAAVDVTGLASYKVDDLAVGVNKLRLIAYDTAENMAFKEISVKVKPPKTAAMLASVA